MVVVGCVLVAVAVGGLVGYRAWRATDQVPVTYVTKQAETMTLISSVSATGNVVLGHTESVSPTITGEVSGLSIKVGDTVTQGQLLFVLVNPQLDLAVSSARAAYSQAEQSLARAELTVLKAEQTLSQLEAQYAAQSSSTAEAASPAAVAVAWARGASDSKVSASAAGSEPETTTTGPESTTTTEPESTTTTHAPPPSTTTTQSPPTTTTPTTGAPSNPGTGGSTGTSTGSTVTALDLEVAKAEVAGAEAAVTVAETQLESAAYLLDQATANAAARQVTAPIGGTVTAVSVGDGDQWGGGGSGGASSEAGAGSTDTSSSTSGTAAVVISDLDSFETTVSLGETDIVGVKVGDKATLTFDALPDLTLVGEVTYVAAAGTVTQGVVTYDVTVVPRIGNDNVKAGMTATAEIITQLKADVLAVPNAAVKTDSSGGYYVLILTDGAPTTQTVETGIANDAYTEITTGLTAGQAVVTQTTGGSTTNTTSRGSTGGILGTGSGLQGGPPDGGGPPPGFGGGG